MFEKGDYIVYGATGICQVKEIGTLSMKAADKDRLYYTLEPLNSKGSSVYTPVDNTKVVIRRILSKKEAEQLICDIPHIEALWVENDKQREQVYRESARKCDCREWIRIIKERRLRRRMRGIFIWRKKAFIRNCPFRWAWRRTGWQIILRKELQTDKRGGNDTWKSLSGI